MTFGKVEMKSLRSVLMNATSHAFLFHGYLFRKCTHIPKPHNSMLEPCDDINAPCPSELYLLCVGKESLETLHYRRDLRSSKIISLPFSAQA